MENEEKAREANRTLSGLLERAKSIRDNLNRNVLTDEMYYQSRTLEEVQQKIDKVQRELRWTSQQAR